MKHYTFILNHTIALFLIALTITNCSPGGSHYECVKDKVPSVVIHAAKTRLGWNEKPHLDITSGGDKINMPVITFIETDTEL